MVPLFPSEFIITANNGTVNRYCAAKRERMQVLKGAGRASRGGWGWGRWAYPAVLRRQNGQGSSGRVVYQEPDPPQAEEKGGGPSQTEVLRREIRARTPPNIGVSIYRGIVMDKSLTERTFILYILYIKQCTLLVYRCTLSVYRYSRV